MQAPPSSKTKPEPGDDGALVARAQAGDAAAFDSLVRRYQDRVFNMALRILGNRDDAADLSQEVFLSAYRSLAQFEARAAFGTWVYRITVNRCRDELRRRASVKHTRPRSLDGMAGADDDERAFEPAARDPAPSEEASARELQRHVEAALAALPDDAREVLVLRETQDLAYEEVAAVLEIPVGTVRSRLNRARALLLQQLRPILEEQA